MKKSQSERTATVLPRPVALSFTVFFLMRIFFNCSKMVYCKTGLMTRTSAGPTPRQNAPTPPLARIFWMVSINPSFFTTTFECRGSSDDTFSVRTACEVCTTHIGFEMIVVADPSRITFSFTGSLKCEHQYYQL